MAKRILTKSNIKQVVDESTGELKIVETEKTYTVRIEPDRFYMVFFEKMASFYGIKHLSDIKLIICMCELAEFNTGVVYLTPKNREFIVGKTKISLSNISRNLKRLMALGLLSCEKGNYTVSPEVFWKGDTKTRSEIIKIDGLNFNIKVVEDK